MSEVTKNTFVTNLIEGPKRSLGFKDGVYDNITQNVAGVAVPMLAGAGLGAFFAGQQLKKGLSKEAYTKARAGVAAPIRIVLPA